jgi:hypothetical protein
MSSPADTVRLFQQAEAVLRETPAFAAALDKARAENLPPEAVARLLLSQLDENTATSLMRLAMSLDTAVVQQPAPPLVVQHANGSAALNPVVEAALAERASLDGDVPEFRFGPIPEGSTPAVPVKTTSRNLVQVGLMLEQASREVAAEYRAALVQHEQSAVLLLEQAEREGHNLAVVRQGIAALVPTGVEGYAAGTVPALREVVPPTTGELARLSPSEERRMVWKAVSTTQGRRSIAHALEHALAEKFPHVQFGPPPQGQVTEVMEWSVRAFGAEDLDPKFALVENVVERFATHLTYDHPNAAVEPINDPSSRIFGWRLHTW